ncbi:MAG: YeeE/YedE family protein [Anaerolineales bacterium]|nr:YeeE/YedE family protein [Anaerolineales bacterium]
MQFPLQAFIAVSAENPWTYVVFGLIGFAFGFTLEMSGFGDSRKLAAQFYFTELTVLKVMFTAIVTAMVLLFGAVGLGLLNFNLVWVNETYLASGILGGLIMGVGFIVGGFCPTTSLASASTGKIDGMFFMLGGFVGVFLFGETQKYFDNWYNHAGYYGRLTLDQVFNLPVGVVVLMAVFMALFMFWGAEQLERIVGKKDMSKEPKIRLAGAGLLAVGAVAVLLIGTPSTETRYNRLTFERESEGQKVQYSADEMLEFRQAQIHPGELLTTLADNRLITSIIDVRPEADYNLFHIVNSVNIPAAEIKAAIPALLADQTPNKVHVVVSNDEAAATDVWRTLVAEAVPNVYILEGGINNWIAVFGQDEDGIRPLASDAEEVLRYTFPAALGNRYECANPSPLREWELEFESKIQLQLKRDKSGGGCG